jgi:hypothetical protein
VTLELYSLCSADLEQKQAKEGRWRGKKYLLESQLLYESVMKLSVQCVGKNIVFCPPISWFQFPRTKKRA